SMEGVGLYYFMGYYTSYFAQLPEEGKAEAISQLLGLLEGSTKDYVRLGAFQSLLSFTEEPGVLESLKKAAEQERQEDLKNYFSYFLELYEEEN
ncbi:MAG: M1 family peptidase, partial [Algoriphagus sp.]